MGKVGKGRRYTDVEPNPADLVPPSTEDRQHGAAAKDEGNAEEGPRRSKRLRAQEELGDVIPLEEEEMLNDAADDAEKLPPLEKSSGDKKGKGKGAGKGKAEGGGAAVGKGKGSGKVERARVVYVGRIPHGFYEEQMRGFFSQFGTILNLRLSRNKKTGNSKHYAFIEFENPDVAAIAADAMNNYLMFSKMLQVRLVPPSQVHPRLFKNANRPFKKIDWVGQARAQREQPRTPAQVAKRVAKLVKGDKKRRKRMAAAGIEYEFEGYAATLPQKSKHTKFSAAE
eukprot:jgi/Mesvir1/4347/Mv02431-RA.1